MDFMAWFGEYQQGIVPCASWSAEAEQAVRACIGAYRRTGEEACRKYVLDWAEALLNGGGICQEACCALLFALDETGDAKYRDAFAALMQAEPAEGMARLPFTMAYEMKLNKMEKVGQAAAAYRAAAQDVAAEDAPAFLQVLADGVAVCSDQLYEHWRALVDLYRGMLPGALANAELQNSETLLHALLQGVQLGLIDPERYLPMAAKRMAALKQTGNEAAAVLMEMEFGVI